MKKKSNKKTSQQNQHQSRDENYKYITAYSKKDYDEDEKRFNDSIENNRIDYSSFRRLMINDLCLNTNILETGYIGEFPLETIMTAIKYPKQYSRILLSVSRRLMHISPHYYRLNMLYGNMALFCWWIDLFDVSNKVNIKTVKTAYNMIATKFENMNIKHEFAKIARILPYQDIYCGLVVENENTFYFQEINYNICKLYQIDDGLYDFVINLSAINPNSLSAYPDYIQQAYKDYKEMKDGCKWYLPPSDKQICIKFNSQWSYPFPVLIGLIKDILDVDVYKKLKLQSARTDNYKAIMVKVPIDEKMVDKPLLTPDTLQIFAEINKENMSDDIGLIHTLGSTGQAISFKDSANTRNNVSDAVNELYNSSGETKELFNGSSTATAVTFSVENDSAFIYHIYRQLERWCNRYIKLKGYNKKTYKFNFYLLDITIFNRDNVSKRYKEACTLGATVIDKWLATLDMTPSRTMGSYILHKDIFDFKNNFVPLNSSYNFSGQTGRPTNDSVGKPLSDEGEKSVDGDKNSI